MSLTLQFIPYGEIEHLNTTGRINKILNIVREEKIILLEGRLERTEETDLIKKTMEEIDEKFKGIELFVMYPKAKNGALWEAIKKNLVNLLLGNRQGITIIGPASIIKEIKKDPDKIQLLTKKLGSATKKKKKK